MSQSTRIDIRELEGKALDWAVATAEGLKSETWHTSAIAVHYPNAPRAVPFKPSTDWSQGGPIVEREKIHLVPETDDTQCHAQIGYNSWDGYWKFFGNGETMLVAAMRCYVESKLGLEIEIPQELLSSIKPASKQGLAP
jgi:hypothetical protein